MLFITVITVFLASTLTLFSGFGLGTIVMPVYAIFYPVEIAIALTAIVHLMNNIFKLVLLGREADKRVVMAFGGPAVIAALVGAWLLVRLQGMPGLFKYSAFGLTFTVSPIKLVVAGVMILFVLLELLPWFQSLTFDRKYLPLGGMLSGFFGGLSGHQGALRSAFLVKCGLSGEAFIGSGVVIACLVDITRLAVYGGHFARIGLGQYWSALLPSILAAYAGVALGRRWITKITVPLLQKIVGVMLGAIAILLAAGII